MRTVWYVSKVGSVETKFSNLLFYIIGKTILAEAYDALDPEGNITMKWDVMSWTPDGYVVSSRTTKTKKISVACWF